MDAQEARIYIAIIITVLVLGVIIFYFALSIIRQQKRNIALQKTNTLAEINAMERERSRMAVDLHDDLGPILSVIKFQVDHVQAITTDEKEQLEQASELLDGLVERIRDIANDLMPVAIKRKGLIAAVEEFINKAAQGSAIAINYSSPASINMTEEKAINIYRAVQETVHNCLRHSAATQLDISISQKGDFLQILCKDNGKGFDLERIESDNSGMGLRSLKNRTEIVGGTLLIESKPGIGTALLFTIPI